MYEWWRQRGNCKNGYTAPNVDVDLYAPQGVDLGGGGFSSQHDVTQQDGLRHSANCKSTLENLPRFLINILDTDALADSSCQVIECLNIFVPHAMDELPIEQSCSQPVNPSHVTLNGLAHYCTHNASVNNSI